MIKPEPDDSVYFFVVCHCGRKSYYRLQDGDIYRVTEKEALMQMPPETEVVQ